MTEPNIIQQMKVDHLTVEVYAGRRELGAASAHRIAGQMRSLLAEKGECRMVFAAAPSQNEFLEELGMQADLDWSRVVAFHMDEYVGLGPAASQSFVRYLREHLYDHVQPGAVHYLNGLAPDPEAECIRYAALLEQAPIDIVCAGIGENGHLAFNDPPYALFDDPQTVKVIQLALRSRQQQVHDGCFATLDDVPQLALTLTLPALLSASHVYAMVPGPTKAEAVRDTLTLPVGENCPSTALRRHPSSVLYVDRDSMAAYDTLTQRS
jgi:glucosamine-6-phosphate deaminase